MHFLVTFLWFYLILRFCTFGVFGTNLLFNCPLILLLKVSSFLHDYDHVSVPNFIDSIVFSWNLIVICLTFSILYIYVFSFIFVQFSSHFTSYIKFIHFSSYFHKFCCNLLWFIQVLHFCRFRFSVLFYCSNSINSFC